MSFRALFHGSQQPSLLEAAPHTGRPKRPGLFPVLPATVLPHVAAWAHFPVADRRWRHTPLPPAGRVRCWNALKNKRYSSCVRIQYGALRIHDGLAGAQLAPGHPQPVRIFLGPRPERIFRDESHRRPDVALVQRARKANEHYQRRIIY